MRFSPKEIVKCPICCGGPPPTVDKGHRKVLWYVPCQSHSDQASSRVGIIAAEVELYPQSIDDAYGFSDGGYFVPASSVGAEESRAEMMLGSRSINENHCLINISLCTRKKSFRK